MQDINTLQRILNSMEYKAIREILANEIGRKRNSLENLEPEHQLRVLSEINALTWARDCIELDLFDQKAIEANKTPTKK